MQQQVTVEIRCGLLELEFNKQFQAGVVKDYEATV